MIQKRLVSISKMKTCLICKEMFSVTLQIRDPVQESRGAEPCTYVGPLNDCQSELIDSSH